jgi:hypothetical protein
MTPASVPILAAFADCAVNIAIERETECKSHLKILVK